jgi:hypothetical protein
MKTTLIILALTSIAALATTITPDHTSHAAYQRRQRVDVAVVSSTVRLPTYVARQRIDLGPRWGISSGTPVLYVGRQRLGEVSSQD